MDRFHLPSGSWSDSSALTGEEAHHCSRVMRKSLGDSIQVFDGEGRRAPATIVSLEKHRVCLELGEPSLSEFPTPRLHLAVGIPKGKTFDLIIQKGVELGLASIQPLTSEFGSVKISDPERKIEKWRRIALEACKQCGQDHLPTVHQPASFKSWLASSPHQGHRLVAALHPEARPLKTVLATCPEPLATVVVGPEGDLSPAEYEAAFAAGFKPVELGSLVLRVETAVFSLVSALRYHFS